MVSNGSITNHPNGEPGRVLASYITTIEKNYLNWYEKSSSINYILWIVCRYVAILAGIASAIVAGFMKEQSFEQRKFWLILLPLLGAGATTLMTHGRIFDQLQILEEGRRAFDTLVQQAKMQAAAAPDAAACLQIHKDLTNKVETLDKEYTSQLWTLFKAGRR